MFIVLEGIDGTGKTYQAKKLKEYFESKRLKVTTTRLPGGTPECETLRKFVLDNKVNLGTSAQAILFQAINAEVCEKVIGPALERGEVVISDRFTTSAIAYQGLSSKFSQKELEELCELACRDTQNQPVRPNVIFVLDGNPEKLINRRAKRSNQAENDRFEAKDITFQKNLRKIYKEYKPKNVPYIFIDAMRKPKDVTLQLIQNIEKLFDK